MGIDWTKQMRAPAAIEIPSALTELQVYDGAVFETTCTCRVRVPACVIIRGEWKPVCADCGSLRT
jgi:hypothetical protein